MPTVLLFAHLKERLGTSRLQVDLPPGATAAGLLEQLALQYPPIASQLAAARVAVNRSFALPDDPIRDQDELAIIPPVSGG